MIELSNNMIALLGLGIVVLVCEVLIWQLIPACLVSRPKTVLPDEASGYSDLIAASKKEQTKKRKTWRLIYGLSLVLCVVVWLTQH